MTEPYRPLWWRPWLEAGLYLPERVTPSSSARPASPDQPPPTESPEASDDVQGYLLGTSPSPEQPPTAEGTGGPANRGEPSGLLRPNQVKTPWSRRPNVQA
jgi:hypothetical protein